MRPRSLSRAFPRLIKNTITRFLRVDAYPARIDWIFLIFFLIAFSSKTNFVLDRLLFEDLPQISEKTSKQ